VVGHEKYRPSAKQKKKPEDPERYWVALVSFDYPRETPKKGPGVPPNTTKDRAMGGSPHGGSVFGPTCQGTSCAQSDGQNDDWRTKTVAIGQPEVMVKKVTNSERFVGDGDYKKTRVESSQGRGGRKGELDLRNSKGARERFHRSPCGVGKKGILRRDSKGHGQDARPMGGKGILREKPGFPK